MNNKTRIAATLLAVSLFAAVVGSAHAAPKEDTFYVAVDGQDGWSGKLPMPNNEHTDGPFATLQRARDAARSVRVAGRPVTISLRGGSYFLKEPLTLTAQDDNTIWEAYRSEQPVLSGGQPITDFQPTAPGRWEVTLPDVQNGSRYFSQLYVNGKRKLRPRLPKRGYYMIADELPPTDTNKEHGYDRFVYNGSEIDPKWWNLSDVEVLCFQIWEMSRLRIANADAATHTVTFAGPTAAKDYWSKLARGHRYIAENVMNALSDPGEWYLNRKNGVLTYLTEPGEVINSGSVIAPRLEQLVTIDGATNITFKGLTFAHTAWNVSPTGYAPIQAETDVNGAIQIANSENITFADCTVEHTGNWGLEIKNGSHKIAVRRCVFQDLGAGGVRIGSGNGKASEGSVARNNTVEDCLITQGGRISPGGIGVLIQQSPFNTITHNEISDFYYTGISVGWTWGYDSSLAHDNVISFNRIHTIGQGVLSDMGGIYTLGTRTGTLLDHNLIYDITGLEYGGWGIYFDEGTSQTVAQNNIVYNTKSAPFHQHYGKENTVVNNIFAFGKEAQLMRTRAEDHLSFTLSHNITLWRDAPLLGYNWDGNGFVLSQNLYWNGGEKPVTFGKANLPLDQWQKSGKDVGSLVADPRFRAAEKGDFRLANGSPVAQIGFVPIDISKVGVHYPLYRPATAAPAFPILK